MIDLSHLKNFTNHIYHSINSRFNVPPVRLDVERKFTICQSIKCFTVRLLMSNYALQF